MAVGKFITFEGTEGSGKSTQARLLHGLLKRKKKKVLLIREPGGVAISEQIRKILLSTKSKKMSQECETLLFMAARAQLVEEVIKPALARGFIVICDRFLDSTIVYQGYGIGVDKQLIRQTGKFATQGITPNLTLVFDLPTQKGLSRTGRIKDRIEQRPLSYHQKIRQGYLSIARREPKRVKIIKADQSLLKVRDVVWGFVKDLVK